MLIIIKATATKFTLQVKTVISMNSLKVHDKENFKIYDAKAWLTNNCNTHIAQYLQK